MNRLVLAAVAAVVGVSIATAGPISGAYTRTGPSETLTAPFTAVNGTPTVNSYSRFVEVIVSGTGFSLGNSINDAFYFVPSGTQLDPQYYQMNIGVPGNPFVPNAGEDNNISRFIVFVDGVGPVTPEYYPAYNATNTYHFVIDMGNTPGQLFFGVSDGVYSDNGGQYSVQVFQVVPNVPEPISLVVFGGLVVGGGLVARKRLVAKKAVA